MEPHLTEEELLSLVDRSYDKAEETRLYRHLLQCDDCLGDLQFMARDKVLAHPGHLSDRERKSLIENGMSLAESARPSASTPQVDAPMPRDKTPRRRIYRIAALAAGLVAVVFAAWIWQTDVPEPDIVLPGSDLGTEVTAPILAAMTSFSDDGDVVMPGTEDEFKPNNGNYRGDATVDEDVSVALMPLSKRFGDGDHSRDLLFWLIGGHISNRDFRSAVNTAGIARKEYPDDAEIATLAALAAFYSDDFDEAERLLRDAVAEEGDTGVAALNLGVVLLAAGEDRVAREMLGRIYDSHPDTPLGRRARAILESGR